MSSPRKEATWVLVRGLARERLHWGQFATLLRRSVFPDSVIALDLPGNGNRCRERTPTTVPQMARELPDLATLARAGSPVFLVGLSLGGMIAIEYLQNRGPLAGLVLINTSVGRLCPPCLRIRPRACLGVVRALVSPSTEARERRILALTSARMAADPAALRSAIAIQHRHPVRRSNAVRQLIAAAGYRPRLSSTDTPILVLAAGNDALVDPKCSNRIAGRFGASLHVHPTAGHDLPLDDPRWCVQRITRWREVELGPPA